MVAEEALLRLLTVKSLKNRLDLIVSLIDLINRIVGVNVIRPIVTAGLHLDLNPETTLEPAAAAEAMVVIHEVVQRDVIIEAQVEAGVDLLAQKMKLILMR